MICLSRYYLSGIIYLYHRLFIDGENHLYREYQLFSQSLDLVSDQVPARLIIERRWGPVEDFTFIDLFAGHGGMRIALEDLEASVIRFRDRISCARV